MSLALWQELQEFFVIFFGPAVLLLLSGIVALTFFLALIRFAWLFVDET